MHLDCFRIRDRFFRLALAVLIACCAFLPPVSALDGLSEDYQAGEAYFKQRQYGSAALEFLRVVARDPRNSDALYYAALSFQEAGNRSRAGTLYRLLLERFPSSRGAEYARRALAMPGMAAGSPALSSPALSSPALSSPALSSQSVSSDSPGSGDTIPDQDSVPFRRGPDGHLYVDCQVNGRSMPMVFDTGAEVCTMGINQLASLGLSIPAGARKERLSGVGGEVGAYSIPTRIGLGNMSRTVNVLFMEKSNFALLGQTFFKDLQYRVDNASGRINFSKPGATSEYIPNDTINIPFKRSGNNLVVTAKVNGAPVPLFFDTGAQGTLFNSRALSASGGQGFRLIGYGTASGVGGSHRVQVYQVDSIELGPIRQSGMRVTVDNALPVPYGLLGQDFFGHRQFIIDDKSNMIRFMR